MVRALCSKNNKWFVEKLFYFFFYAHNKTGSVVHIFNPRRAYRKNRWNQYFEVYSCSATRRSDGHIVRRSRRAVIALPRTGKVSPFSRGVDVVSRAVDDHINGAPGRYDRRCRPRVFVSRKIPKSTVLPAQRRCTKRATRGVTVRRSFYPPVARFDPFPSTTVHASCPVYRRITGVYPRVNGNEIATVSADPFGCKAYESLRRWPSRETHKRPRVSSRFTPTPPRDFACGTRCLKCTFTPCTSLHPPSAAESTSFYFGFFNIVRAYVRISKTYLFINHNNCCSATSKRCKWLRPPIHFWRPGQPRYVNMQVTHSVCRRRHWIFDEIARTCPKHCNASQKLHVRNRLR